MYIYMYRELYISTCTYRYLYMYYTVCNGKPFFSHYSISRNVTPTLTDNDQRLFFPEKLTDNFQSYFCHQQITFSAYFRRTAISG
jgi:hypothetical protein